MINFIIYEDDPSFRKKYIGIILKIMGNKQDEYKITEVSEYNETIQEAINSIGKKIYILDIDVPKKSGMDLAREIRNSGDWNSQIIMVTTHDSLQQTAFTSRLLTLDFISKFDELNIKLKKALLTSYLIHTSDKSLKIKKNNEVKQFYYDDILYIKKDPKDIDIDIVLKDNSHNKVPVAINQIEEELLNDIRFFKSHRSCIINLSKVKSLNISEGTIDFGKEKIDLFSREARKKYKEEKYEQFFDYKENK